MRGTWAAISAASLPSAWRCAISYSAVVPTITGRAWITGFEQYVVDAEDPFPEGFTVGDIWGQ